MNDECNIFGTADDLSKTFRILEIAVEAKLTAQIPWDYSAKDFNDAVKYSMTNIHVSRVGEIRRMQRLCSNESR